METTLKSKVVTLETDNDHYLNKIHQYEEEVSDLKNNLENTLENLITTQNEYEEYKNKKEEEIERLKRKLQEEKGNIRALMNQRSFAKHSRIKSSYNLKQLEEKEEVKEVKKTIAQRKLSWSEESNLRAKLDEKGKNNNDKNHINEDEEENELDRMLKMGRNYNRRMTIQKNRYNFGNI